MDIPRQVLKALEQRYGKPKVFRWQWYITDDEWRMIKASQKDGRKHDVTLFIFRKGKLVVIRKPQHPPSVYRAPSGAVKQGEDFESGVLREAFEETGLNVKLLRYIFRVRLKFLAPSGTINWTTHVFVAKAVGRRLKPIDTNEISDAKYVTLEELQTKIRQALIESQRPLLYYRAKLTDMVVEFLRKPLTSPSNR